MTRIVTIRIKNKTIIDTGLRLIGRYVKNLIF